METSKIDGDETDQARRDRAFRERLVADAMPQIVWTSSPNGDVEYYNRRWLEYTGLTFEETRGQGWQPVLHPGDRQRAIDNAISGRLSGETYENEYRLKRASDGAYRWHLARVAPLRDEEGRIECWVGTSTDIHDYKLAQESQQRTQDELERRVSERTAQLAETVARLEAEKRFVAAIVDNVSEGIVACDARGVLSFFNTAARTFHGMSSEPIPQERWAEHYDLFLADGQTQMTTDQLPLARAFRGEEIGSVEMVIKPRSLPPRRVLVGGHAFYDAAGNKLGALIA